MDTPHLTQEQRDRLKALMIKQREVFARLRRRMGKAQWATDDAVYQIVLVAEHACHAAVQVIGKTVDRSGEPKPPVYDGRMGNVPNPFRDKPHPGLKGSDEHEQ